MKNKKQTDNEYIKKLEEQLLYACDDRDSYMHINSKLELRIVKLEEIIKAMSVTQTALVTLEDE
jgi:hypothetical protein